MRSGDKNEKVVVVDCDDTLVMWGDNHTQPQENSIPISDPIDGEVYHLIPHYEHVRLVKHFYNRDYFVIVHSASGGRWAEAVVKALDLSNHVHMTMAKCLKYVDDLDASHWMGNRIYLPYKK